MITISRRNNRRRSWTSCFFLSFVVNQLYTIDSGGWRWMLILLTTKLSPSLAFYGSMTTYVWSPSFIFSLRFALALKHDFWSIRHFRTKPRIFPSQFKPGDQTDIRLNKYKYNKRMSSAFLSAGKEEPRSDAFWCGGAKKYNKIISLLQVQSGRNFGLIYHVMK